MILRAIVGSCRARKADTLTFQQIGSVGSVSRTVSQHKFTDVLTFRSSPVSSAIYRGLAQATI